MAEDEVTLPSEPVNGLLPEADAPLLALLRAGDVEAGHRFVRAYYPAIYRYLLYLTGHRESAEDLTQETFVRAWGHLDQFQGRAPLRLWLHTIARREFLQAKRRQRAVISLEEATELAAPQGDVWTEDAELRVLLGKLPEEQREVMALHHLGGYSSNEIAQIIQVPSRTVRHRLAAARFHLAQALGSGDLAYLNEASVPMRQWAWLPLDQIHALETRLSRGGAVDRQAPGRGAGKEDEMERREFLRHAAVGAAGLMLPEAEKQVVDSRLTHRVTCAFKGTALSDLCEKLKTDTGIQVTAGPSVADEKVTLFCEKLSLREVMRQLSRPFGYTWLRSGKPGEYRYELVQDLRSQLLEEELRNRDRNEALLALDQEIGKYRPYLDFSPDELLARAKTASPAEKKLLENLGGGGPRSGLAWGVIQMYFRLTSQELAALRAGQELSFSQEPKPGERPLPPDVARGVLQSVRDWRLFKTTDGYQETEPDDPRGVPLTAVPEARALVSLTLSQTELGQFGLGGLVGYSAPGAFHRDTRGPYAVGVSPRTLQPENAVVNAKLAGDPALRSHISLQPQPSCGAARHEASGASKELRPTATNSDDSEKATTADVLEALHRAAGVPVVSDFYTRLYPPGAVSIKNQPLFDTLNQLSDTMGLRWNKEPGTREAGAWLQFRSMTYYHDRLKEVPNRLLLRWSAARREHGLLPLDDLCEIAQLPDEQLQAASMAEGARECWGLAEWDLARNHMVLPNLRFLALLTPAQRQEAQSVNGLLFTKMSRTELQAFFTRQFYGQPEMPSREELAETTLRVDYTQPGWFEWRPPGPPGLRWAVPLAPGPEVKRVPRPVVRERTREAALQALRRVDPAIRAAARAAALAAAARAGVPSATVLIPEEAQIAPTRLELTTIYIPGTTKENITFWATDLQSQSI